MLRKTTKTYFIPLTVATLLAILGFGLILVYVNPYHTIWLGHIFFYLTLLLSVCGIATTISLFVRNKFWTSNYLDIFSVSIRQGILIAILVTTLVFLETLNVLFWWVALILILFLLAIEFFFSTPNN